MGEKNDKTNAMRALDALGVSYKAHFIASDAATSGEEAALALGADPARVFKTLVTAGRSGEHYVFMIPAARELDLKKAAAWAREKSVEMIKARELLPLTGYVHGGCSPIGMKKPFPTAIDSSAEGFETIIFSGGRIGRHIETSLAGLRAAIPVRSADLTVKR